MAKTVTPVALATLPPIDRDLLAVACAQRVVTTHHLERLFHAVSPRTLRYRTLRLLRAGLLGRTRPYRPRGSAPFFFWPTRLADAYVRGQAPPLGGPRDEPNPFFLSHAAGITEVYVGLATGGAPGLRLERFVREADAREPFQAADRPRAIAPDARIALRDSADRLLLAHVELDRGTMSIPQLRTKASGYAAYWFSRPWSKTYPFCPALLFVTTTEARARSVLGLLGEAARRAGHTYSMADPAVSVAACALADAPARALAEPCWQHLTRKGALTLGECLVAARARLELELAAAAKELEARAQQLGDLRADPQRLRAHLNRFERGRLSAQLASFGLRGCQALAILLEGSGAPAVIEREAFAAVSAYLGDNLLDLDEAPPARPAPDLQARIDRLADSYRVRQSDLVTRLLAQHGPLDVLRAAREELSRGGLLGPSEEETLPEDAQRDAAEHSSQRQRRAAYLIERDRMARERAGIAGRLLGRLDQFAADLDVVLLRICRDCSETAYPQWTASGRLLPAQACSRCGGCALRALDRGPNAAASRAG